MNEYNQKLIFRKEPIDYNYKLILPRGVPVHRSLHPLPVSSAPYTLHPVPRFLARMQ